MTSINNCLDSDAGEYDARASQNLLVSLCCQFSKNPRGKLRWFRFIFVIAKKISEKDGLSFFSPENLQKKLTGLKRELKCWESMFFRSHGRKPTKVRNVWCFNHLTNLLIFSVFVFLYFITSKHLITFMVSFSYKDDINGSGNEIRGMKLLLRDLHIVQSLNTIGFEKELSYFSDI